MARYILTGTPGAGKTTLLRLLEQRGHPVVEEAATDVIALEQALGRDEPWADASFIDLIVALQKQRQMGAGPGFFDRSPVCTWALSEFLGFEPSAVLRAEIERIEVERTYERSVFFVQNLGFVTPTAARRISYEDALRFEQVHLEAYRRFGYDLVLIPPGDLAARADQVLANTPFQ
ncbi:AAA family ATPase [Phenylobacterium sp. 20VBR1]|uniref:AAA family ATPase n=1 Tax=Phenylobacterium glaciei TaxID=2803784 RepID=A0A941CW75_9CAUL|nr:AAA family ATPase [Phenylobacterium glaciei]MBR7617826.1 AAA family ATPase [Phenylobacterium glaciei]QQZ50471.1 AAA family ATPase [Phenylobacterium glaciei]